MREPQALTTSTETGRDAAQHWVTLGHWRIPVRLALRFFAEMKAMIGIVQADRRAPVDRVALGHLRSGPLDRGPGPDPRNWACWQTGTQGPPTLNPASPTSPPVAFGFKDTDALISLAMLALGGYRPDLPGRSPA